MPAPTMPLNAIAISPARPTARSRRGVESGAPRIAGSDVVEDADRRPAEDGLLLLGRDVEFLDRRHRAIDRAEQMRVVAAHHHVIGPHQLAGHAEGRRAEAHRVVVETLEIRARQLADAGTALREVAKA